MGIKKVHVTPVITAAAVYHVGDAVGGKLEFEDVCTPYANFGEIAAAMVHDNDGDNANLFLSLFTKDFTPSADHAAFSVSDADLANCIVVIEFTNADYIDYATNSVCHAQFHEGFQPVPYVLVEGGTSLFGQLHVSANVATYAATDDLQVMLLIKT